MKKTKNNGDGKRFPKAATPSEPHYRNLVANAVIGIIDVTLDGKVIYANQAAAKMVGYDSPDEARKVNAISLWHDPKKREEFISKLFEFGYVNNFEVEYITRTGKIITVLSSATLHGDVISSMVIDISEHAHARSMLEQSDSRLRRAAEISKTGNWDLDFLTDELFWSDEVYRIFGLTAKGSPLRYERFLEAIVPEDRDYADRSWQAALRGEPYDIEHRIQVGAQLKWVREKAEIEFDAAGRPVRAAGIVQDITESKRADEALRESREKLVKAGQVAHMGFLEWDLKSNQIELSDEVYGMYGIAQGISQTADQILDLVHPDDRDLVKKNLDMAVQGIHDFNIDHRVVRPDNKVIWVHARAELKYDKDGDPFFLMGTVVDITERKEAEEAERILAERLKQVMENAQEWVWEVDADGLYTYSSPVVEDILGYTPEEIVGKKHFYDFFDPEERETHKKAALGVFREKQPFVSFVNVNVHKSGAKVWLSCNGMPILDEHGELRGYRGSDTDITERKKAEEKLLISDEIIANVTEGVNVVRAEDGIIIFTNPALDDMLGYEPNELIGKHVSVINAPTDQSPKEIARRTIETLRNAGKWRGEMLNLRKDGSSVWCDASLNSFDDPEYGRVLVGVRSDITDRINAREELLVSGEIIANMAEGVHITRADDGIIVFTNPAFDRMFGYQPNELLGRHISIVNAPTDKDPEETAREIIKVLDYTSQWQGEVLNLRKDGSTFWSYVNISNIEHPKHGLAWVSVHSDITEQKKANEVKAALLHDIGERLKETECMYKISDAIRTKDSLDEIFQDIVSALPPGWHYPDITRGKLRYKEKTWVSEEFEETEWKQSSDIVIAGQILGCVEVYYLEPCPVLDEGPFMMEERKLIDNIGRTISEVIEHQIAQELLKDSEASLRMIYEFAPIMIDAFDKNGRCIMWNKECEKVFGWTAEEMFSQENPLTLFYPDPEIQQRVIESVIHAPDTTPKEWNPLRKDGSETTCLWANYMLPNGNIICLGQDITERKEAEKKVEKYQGRLKSLASQLTLAEEQERRRIAADLHDHIGQSLALTRLQLATARKGLPKNDKRDAQFNEISQALLQAIQDTRNLIFELSSPSLNELGLGAAIKEWVEEQVENKHGLQTEFLDDAQGVELGDDMRAILYRNVRELLTNSIKHADAKTVSVALKGTANQLTITIQDDGKGFDPEETPQNARSPGSFGLFSIQERMADLGGEFEIVSQPGTGSKVTLRVPIEGQTAGGRA